MIENTLRCEMLLLAASHPVGLVSLSVALFPFVPQESTQVDLSRSKDHQDNALFIFHVYLPYPEHGDYGRLVGPYTSRVRFPQLWELCERVFYQRSRMLCWIRRVPIEQNKGKLYR